MRRETADVCDGHENAGDARPERLWLPATSQAGEHDPVEPHPAPIRLHRRQSALSAYERAVPVCASGDVTIWRHFAKHALSSAPGKGAEWRAPAGTRSCRRALPPHTCLWPIGMRTSVASDPGDDLWPDCSRLPQMAPTCQHVFGLQDPLTIHVDCVSCSARAIYSLTLACTRQNLGHAAD
jgi:hypothetical protein